MIHRKIRLAGFLIMCLIMVVGFCAAADENIPGENTTATVMIVIPADAAGDDTILLTSQPVFGNTSTNDNLTPYDGPNGPGSALYGFKIAMENLDETFTFNQTDRLNKQMDHAQLRIRETLRELALNRSDRADEALDLYWQKLNQTQETLAPFGANSTGLLHAQEMIVHHQAVLASLQLSHPNNTGLVRAYNNSRLLEQKFEEKTLMNTIRKETEYQNRNGTGTGNQIEIQEQTRQNVKVQGNQTQNIPPWKGEITKQTQKQEQKQDIPVSPQQTQKLSDSPNGQEGNDKNMGKQQGNDNEKGRNT